MSEVIETMNEVEALKPAGFWRRLGARIIDFLLMGRLSKIVAIVFLVILTPILVFFNIDYESELSKFFLDVILLNIPVFLYTVLFVSSSWKATIGKKALDMYVVTDKNEKLTFLRSTMREFILWSPMIFIFIFIPILSLSYEDSYQEALVNSYDKYFEILFENKLNALWVMGLVIVAQIAMIAPIIFRKDKKGLHDIICGTRVLKGKK